MFHPLQRRNGHVPPYLPLCLFLALAIPAARPATVLAQSMDEACAFSDDVPIEVTPVFDEPGFDHSLDTAHIRAMAGDESHTLHEELTLGVTRYEPVLEFRVKMEGYAFASGATCQHAAKVDVTIGFRNVTVYVAREIPEGSCGFNEVLAHEQKHVEVNRQVLAEFAPVAAERLREYLIDHGSFRTNEPELMIAALHDNMQAILNEAATAMNEEDRRRQQQIDSPAEYRRVSASCGGQLQRLRRFGP